MAFKGYGKTMPSSRYAAALNVIEATGWTYDEYLAAPWDLVVEEEVRIAKRALAQKPVGAKHGK